MSHDWLTVHRVVFPEQKDGRDAPLPGPKGAAVWRFYPYNETQADGSRIAMSQEWGGFAAYGSRDAAEAVLADPLGAFPWMEGAVESWHALAVPISHRGEVLWRDTVESGTAISPCDSDPGGPLLVLTSAGYDDPGPHQAERIGDFFRRVEEVMHDYRADDRNLRASYFSGYAVDRHDGCTMTLWQSDDAMLQVAYHPGVHRTQMDRQKAMQMADRTSFTRARILASNGTWDAQNPVAMP